MKTKSALFISAALTAFVLALLTGVVSAFNTAKTNEALAAGSQVQAAPVVVPVQADPTATQPAQVGPEQAASLAAQFMNKTDVYSVESTSINGVNAFKVVFSSGDIVFVALDGSILSTEKLQPAIVVPANPTAAPRKHNNAGGSEEHQEHEGDDD